MTGIATHNKALLGTVGNRNTVKITRPGMCTLEGDTENCIPFTHTAVCSLDICNSYILRTRRLGNVLDGANLLVAQTDLALSLDH
jgi:hypothetical protein